MMPEAQTETPYWSVEAERLLQQLKTTERGLTQSAADERLAGASSLKSHRVSAWSLLLDQFKAPIIILLFCSAVLMLSLAVHDAWSSGEPFRLTDSPDA